MTGTLAVVGDGPCGVRGEPASVGRGLSLEEIEAEAKATTKKAKAAANQERADLATKHADKIDGLMEFGLGLRP
jgi:hypothetical protein